MLDFALNQVTMSEAPFGRFVEVAAELGCVGVEARNDLGRAIFDGMPPAAAGETVRAAGLRLLGLSQVYPFNRWSDAIAEETRALIDVAAEAGAETISLIPCNERESAGPVDPVEKVLAQILPFLQEAGMMALVEPLGFTHASLRLKSEVVAAIEALDAQTHIRLVHDTFHHKLAGGGPIYPALTGLVHLSGVESDIPIGSMEDEDRVLVHTGDRLGNLTQIHSLIDAGYRGAFSFECFAPEVRRIPAPEEALRQSMDFISSHVQQRAA